MLLRILFTSSTITSGIFISQAKNIKPSLVFMIYNLINLESWLFGLIRRFVVNNSCAVLSWRIIVEFSMIPGQIVIASAKVEN